MVIEMQDPGIVMRMLIPKYQRPKLVFQHRRLYLQLETGQELSRSWHEVHLDTLNQLVGDLSSWFSQLRLASLCDSKLLHHMLIVYRVRASGCQHRLLDEANRCQTPNWRSR